MHLGFIVDAIDFIKSLFSILASDSSSYVSASKCAVSFDPACLVQCPTTIVLHCAKHSTPSMSPTYLFYFLFLCWVRCTGLVLPHPPYPPYPFAPSSSFWAWFVSLFLDTTMVQLYLTTLLRYNGTHNSSVRCEWQLSAVVTSV